MLHYFIVALPYNYFGNKLYRQIVGIPMGISCAPLVADLFVFFFALKEIS